MARTIDEVRTAPIGEALGACPHSEISESFLVSMVRRMHMSFHKYGPIREAFPKNVNAVKCALNSVAAYTKTGNIEYLVDSANYLMIEAKRPLRKRAYWKAGDADLSPGRVWNDGEVSQRYNDFTPA
jgi:hypothetical protein